jgi:hypothetical protein
MRDFRASGQAASAAPQFRTRGGPPRTNTLRVGNAPWCRPADRAGRRTADKRAIAGVTSPASLRALACARHRKRQLMPMSSAHAATQRTRMSHGAIRGSVPALAASTTAVKHGQ